MHWKKNLYILWLAQLLSLMSFGFGLPFLPFYLESLGVSDPTTLKLYIGIMSVGPGLSMALMAPIWGKLADKYGRKLMILRAMAAGSIILALMGMVTGPLGLIVLRTLQGLFTGTVTAASAFVAANTPKEHLSYALGFLASATFLGFSIGPALGGITGDYFGFRVSFFMGAFLMLIGLFIALRYLKEDPNSFGHDIGGEKPTLRFKDFFKVVGILLFMIMIQRFVRSVFAPYMPLYVKDLHGPVRVSSWTGFVGMCTGIATAIAGITLTRLGDKLQKNKVIQVLLTLSILVSIGLIINKSFWGFVVLYTLFFFFLGGVEPLMTSLSAERVSPKNRGLLFGYQGMLGSIGFMLAPLLGTYVSIQFDYQALFYVMTAILLINLFFNVLDMKGKSNVS